MNCPNCEVPFRPESETCEVCGSELPPHCMTCGIEVPKNVEICVQCRTERMPTISLRTLKHLAFEVPSVPLPLGLELKPKFVGRHDVLERIAQTLEQSKRDGQLHFMTVVGAPGVGKSSLTGELARSIAEANPDILVLPGRAGGPGAPPFAAFIRLLATLLGFEEGQTPDEARNLIVEGVKSVIPESRVTEVSHLLGQLMRIQFAGSPVIEPLLSSPAQLEMRIFIAFRRFLAAHAEKRPMVMIFDDMERASPETVNLLHYLAAGLARLPVLILSAGRPPMRDLHPRWGEGEFESHTVELAPLEGSEAVALLQELLTPAGELPDALRTLVELRLDGSPRTVEELVRYLVESDVIDTDAEPWSIDGSALEALDVPTTHEEILEMRIANLAEGDREVIEKCAACGEAFWLEGVVALVRAKANEGGEPDGPSLEVIADTGDRTHASVQEALDRHATRGLIVETGISQIRGQREYRFAYPPIWNLVYDAIEPRDRELYHRVIAQWLELMPEGRSGEQQEEVARHLELAGDGPGAAMRYRRAADTARLMHYNEKAIRLYRQALHCLAEHDVGARIHLWHDLGSVQALRGEYEDALAGFEKMLRLSWVMNSRAKGGVAFNKMGRIWRQKGDLELALQYLEKGKDLFEQAGDLRGIAGSRDDIGQVLRLQGRYAEALEQSAQGLEGRRRLGDPRSIALSLANVGSIEMDRGLFDAAVACFQEALELRREIDDTDGIVRSLNALAVIEFQRGNVEAATELWQEGIGHAEAIGAIPLQAMLLNNLGEAAMEQGNTQMARQRLEEAVHLARLLEERRVLSDALRNQAELEVQAGNTDAARSLGKEALSVARAAGIKEMEGRALIALGNVHASTLFDDSGEDPTEAARKYFDEAVTLFREMGNEGELGKALKRYGEFMVERGGPDQGKTFLEEARQLFQKLGMKAEENVSKMIDDVG